MRKRRFLTQKAAFCKEETPLYFRHTKDGLFLMFFEKTIFAKMYPKRRFWIHIAGVLWF